MKAVSQEEYWRPQLTESLVVWAAFPSSLGPMAAFPSSLEPWHPLGQQGRILTTTALASLLGSPLLEVIKKYDWLRYSNIY